MALLASLMVRLTVRRVESVTVLRLLTEGRVEVKVLTGRLFGPRLSRSVVLALKCCQGKIRKCLERLVYTETDPLSSLTEYQCGIFIPKLKVKL